MASNTYASHAWWKEAVVYQVYPASFLDSNGDGWGDLKGVISKLDHIKKLGADVIWMSPINKSPKVDMGYDISDYRDIDPLYGTLQDVDTLIAELKKRDMKLMMDLVLNHTSDQHEWFIDSSSSASSEKRDYYIWKKGRFDDRGNRIPPNNWSMILGNGTKSAWTWSEQRQEYYLSLFTAQQPDLNWENESVREDLYDILRFWLDRGVNGFRLDVINMISKHQDFPDAEITSPGDPYQSGVKYYANGPRMHEFLKEMHRKVLSQYQVMTVGEMPHAKNEDEILATVGADANELNMIFIFDIVDIDAAPGGNAKTLHPWNANDLKAIVSRWQRVMHDRNGWNALFCENHDTPRSVSRYTDDSDEYRELGAKLISLMMTTLGGTLYVYQGQELGLRNVPPSWDVSEYKDIGSITYWNKMKALYPNNPERWAEARKILQRKARDNTRTPMHWTPESPNAGFCPSDVVPWMRVNDDHPTINAEVQDKPAAKKDDLTVYQFWKLSLAQRKEYKDVFVYGSFALVGQPDDENVIAYRRYSHDDQFITILNFSGKSLEWHLPAGMKVDAWVAGNYGGIEKAKSDAITLRPWEALLGKL